MFLADQELSGRQPVNVVQEVDQFQDIGYYIDERGIRHFGEIPRKQQIEFNTDREEYYDPYRIESSDPRIYEVALQSGVYWKN